MAVGLRDPETIKDNFILAFGDHVDAPFVLSSAGLAANTALSRVLLGTPVTPIALAANSLIVANKTASGDILLAVNKGGTSYMAFMADASTGDTLVGVSTGQSFDVYIAGAKVLDYAAALAAVTPPLSVTDATDATSSTAGAMKTAGGLAVAKKAFVGTDLNIGGQEILSTNIIRARFTVISIADNTATNIFTITTVNEAGDTDGGVYSAKVHAVIAHGGSSSGQTNSAVKGFSAIFARVMEKTGTGVNTVVSEIVETASAANTSATRDIGAVTMTVVETSEYIQTIQFTIDLTGTAVDTATVAVAVELVYYGFTTAPALAVA